MRRTVRAQQRRLLRPYILWVAGLALAAVACGGGSSGPSGRIVYVDFRNGNNQEIWVMNADGSDQHSLTPSPKQNFDPDWSPDGTQIVFASDRGGETGLYVMNADGRDVRALKGGEEGTSPQWSHDGKRIAFSRAGDLAVVDAGGGTPQVILKAQTGDQPDECHAGAFPGGWSPDDKQIAYYSALSTRLEAQVCTMNADGSGIKMIVGGPGVFAARPGWSPDGKQLSYRGITNGVHDIWVVDLATGNKTNLTNSPDLDIDAAWSPDGEWIAYGALKAGQPTFDIYIMRKDGSDVRRLTTDPAKQASPAWTR